jgi:hypothetical protein
MESIFSVFDGQGSFSSLVERWGNAAQMSWTHELGSDSDSTKDANWISSVVELGTEDLNISSSSNWTSKRSNLRKAWWVEEDEFKSISDILVVESQL